MKLLSLLSSIVFFIHLNLFSQNMPFPQHVKYKGGILPTYSSQTDMDIEVKTFYEKWKSKYLIQGCDTGEYYIDFTNPDNNLISTSEGHGYGMMITAYMAGYDTSARTIFDGLYAFWLSHQGISANLMAWEQLAGCLSSTEDNKQSATDGDVDVAYSLLLADKQWGSTGAINYKAKAIDVMNAILTYQTNGNLLKLGGWYTNNNSKFGTSTRSSDFITDHFKAFKIASENSKWGNIANSCYTIIDSIQKNYSSTTGLIPDFITKANSKPTPVTGVFLETANDGKYYYNACRVPWRIGTDFLLTGDTNARNTVYKITNWLSVKCAYTVSKINSGYDLLGTPISGENYASPAFIGPFAVGAMCDVKYQVFLNRMYEYLNNYNQQSQGYYENTIAMLCMIVLSSNYWSPVDLSLAINSLQLNNSTLNIKVYPNPTSSSFIIAYNTSISNEPLSINIYNQQAQLIKELKNVKNSTSIDLSNQEKGLYYIKYFNSTDFGTQKIILN